MSEVSRLSVYVHVLSVEARSSFGECSGQDLANRVEELCNASFREPTGGCVWVNTRGPKRLIGVNVADSTDECLIKHELLDTGAPFTQCASKSTVVEGRIERVAGNVLGLTGKRWTEAPEAPRVRIIRGHEIVDCKRPEHALIDEVNSELSPLRMVDPHANSDMPIVGCAGLANEDLTAHAEVCEQSSL